ESCTMPKNSPILTRSPCLKARRYARLYPEIMFPIREVDPKEKINPMSSETPLNASEFEPGMYGYAATTANAITTTRTRRCVGFDHAGSKLDSLTVPCSRAEKNRRFSFNKYHVSIVKTSRKIIFGIAFRKPAPNV